MPHAIINGRRYELPGEDDLTFGEIADIEEAVGQGYDLANPGGKSLLAMVWITLRREQPNLTLSDVRSMPFKSVEILDDDASDDEEGEAESPLDAQATGDEQNGDGATGAAVDGATSGHPS